jgi:GAF domain-containing protein
MSDYGPEYCDVRDPDAREKHKAVSCPDKILTAFCQLGALRLRARRCLIFFFDVNQAYIMAEATQTLSLEDDAIYEPGDEVWMGHSIIPRDIACCETTVNLPSFPISAAVDDDIRKSAFVVNDLTKHPDLSTRPYVTSYPNGRFYAGVPITTSSGVNIGAYCILDDKVRDGVSEKDLIFLRDMSQTVMTHLETVRALAERQQINRMVAGLGDFVRGASDVGRKAPPARHAINQVNQSEAAD